jgi:hypothetical protein
VACGDEGEVTVHRFETQKFICGYSRTVLYLMNRFFKIKMKKKKKKTLDSGITWL